MEPEWRPVIVWLCLGLFALAEFGNIQLGGEIRRVCELAGQPLEKAAAEEIGAICVNRVADDNYLHRLDTRQARAD
jgi:hypothetical protein